MTITPITALTNNYIWLILTDSEVIAVDPGESAPLIAWLQHQQRDLTAIWLTHDHADHLGGVPDLKKQYPQCQVFGSVHWPLVNQPVVEGSHITCSAGTVTVWQIPGHTADHVAYLLLDQQQQLHVFCGDTLFSAGCGRVFSGTINQLFQSLQRFNQLPANTLFYPAHEYTAANLRFALQVEPHNQAMQQALAHSIHTPTLPVTLAHERQINPFLRLTTAQLQQHMQMAGLTAEQCTQPQQAFAFLRAWKDRY